VLPVLPRELVFMYPSLFRSARSELLAWLINIGHGMVTDLVEDLASGSTGSHNGHPQGVASTNLTPRSINPDQAPQRSSATHSLRGIKKQEPLSEIVGDRVAWPILNEIGSLTSVVDIIDSRTVQVRYLTQRYSQTCHEAASQSFVKPCYV